MPKRLEREPPEPWRGFLVALDSLIAKPVDLHCIGGFVVALQYGSSRETSDIDVLAARGTAQLAEIERLAGEGSSLHKRFRVYLQPVGIAIYPEDYEQRLIRMWPKAEFERVRLFALEPHDLALTKIERNSDVDRQDVVALARAGLIDAATLRTRYDKEFRPNIAAGVEKVDLTIYLWTSMISEVRPR